MTAAGLGAAVTVEDLVPGDPDGLGELADWFTTSSRRMDDVMRDARVPTEPIWTGTAADGFRTALGELLAHGHDLADTLATVAAAILDYQAALVAARTQAGRALAAYRRARTQHDQASRYRGEVDNAEQLCQLALAAMTQAERDLVRARAELANHTRTTTLLVRVATTRLNTPFPDHPLNQPSHHHHDLDTPPDTGVGSGEPDTAAPPDPPPSRPPHAPTPLPAPPRPASGSPATPPDTSASDPGAVWWRDTGGGAADLGEGLVLGAGLVAALSAITAAATATPPGPGRRAARRAAAPVIRRLRLPTPSTPDHDSQDTPDPRTATPPPAPPVAPLGVSDGSKPPDAAATAQPPGGRGDVTPAGAARAVVWRGGPGPVGPGWVALGSDTTGEVRVDLAAVLGLGVVGPVAADTLRAVLLAVLTAHPAARVLLARDDAVALFGTPTPHGSRSRHGRRLALVVLPTLGAVLDRAEAELLTRARLTAEHRGRFAPPPLLLAVAATDPTQRARLRAITTTGAAHGVLTVVLGDWPSGLTCHIDPDGRITTATGPAHDQLTGVTAHTSPAPATTDILRLLTTRPNPDSPGDPDTVATDPDAADLRAQPPSTASPTPDGTGAGPDNPALDDAAPAEADTDDANLPSEDGEDGAPDPERIRRLLNPDTPTTTPAGSGIATRLAPPTVPDDQRPLTLKVLGRVALTHNGPDGPASIALPPKQREVLTYLALHRDGVRREALTAVLWPEAPTDRPSNAFHATLSQLRRTVRARAGGIDDLISPNDGHYRLNPDTVAVDLWRVTDALGAYRDAPPADRAAALHEVTRSYTGPLGEGISGDWFDVPREALRRHVLDTLATHIHAVRDHDPRQALGLLEHARELDPSSEAISRDIMRVQARLGHPDMINRTLELLRATLADLDATPSPETEALAAALLRRATATPPPNDVGG